MASPGPLKNLYYQRVASSFSFLLAGCCNSRQSLAFWAHLAPVLCVCLHPLACSRLWERLNLGLLLFRSYVGNLLAHNDSVATLRPHVDMDS